MRDYQFQSFNREARKAHENASNRTVIGDGGQEASPQLAAGLKHPRFVVNPVSDVNDTTVSVIGKYIEPVEANEFGGAFDQFLGQELPVGSACEDDELIISPNHAAKAHNAGAKHDATTGPGGREVFGYDNLWGQLAVDPLGWDAPDHARRAFTELSQFKTMRRLQHAQALHDPHGLK